ncbi:MAG TPA: VOC family protein [Thermomicrobiales bacterium]|nr:VOC family protein [Thermomicrobiales bacterium]
MAISRPDAPVTIRFLIEDETYDATVRRGQIIHEAFHLALPSKYTVGCRLTFSSVTGEAIFADNFAGQIEDHFPSTGITTTATPITGTPGPWRTIGFDHLAISVADRADATSFFTSVVGMRIMRDDPHLTVLATPSTALFLFDAGSDEPLSPDRPSSWHHIGFVVDDLEHAYAHLRQHEDRIQSDFTLLERDERWSLYFFYENGPVKFMIQFSEVKPESRGFTAPESRGFADYLYDYTSRPYGVQFEDG